jgi:hypothetical protein
MVTQEEITTRLKQLFGENNVISEWNVAKLSRDDLTRRLYCPRVDIAVGPFNIDRNLEPNNLSISEAYTSNLALIEAIKGRSDVRNRTLELNQNPRCFIAIEIENRTGPKHRIGSMVNASAIGKIGIMTASNRTVLNDLAKIREYLEFLETVGKSKYNPTNVMIVLAEDLLEVLVAN